MKKVKLFVATNKVGSKIENEIEFDDDVTLDEIEEYFKEWVWNNINANWYIDEKTERMSDEKAPLFFWNLA